MPPVHWFASEGGLNIYQGGKLIATIPVDQFPELLFRLAEAQRSICVLQNDSKPLISLRSNTPDFEE